MKITQNTIEQLLYVLLLLTFLINIIGVGIIIHVNQQLDRQQKIFHQDSINSLQTIKENQLAQSQATKTYIDCLLKINPKGNVPVQEKICFNEAPALQK